jgi:hypothetical protein
VSFTSPCEKAGNSDLAKGMDGPVSANLWIYFAVTVPLTAITIMAWWSFDQRIVRLSGKKIEEDEEQGEHRMNEIEMQIMRQIRRRTGARVTTV